MAGFEQVDFYTDRSLVEDPFPYFEYLRSQGPVCRLPRRNVIAITGVDEALTVLNDTKTFASVNSTNGPIPDLPGRIRRLGCSRPRCGFSRSGPICRRCCVKIGNASPISSTRRCGWTVRSNARRD